MYYLVYIQDEPNSIFIPKEDILSITEDGGTITLELIDRSEDDKIKIMEGVTYMVKAPILF